MSNQAQSFKDILESIKIEDFEDGLNKEEKFNLAKDLTVMHNVLQNHDSVIFQLVAGMNALQKILMEKVGVSEEELQNTIKDELDSIQGEFIKRMSEAKE